MGREEGGGRNRAGTADPEATTPMVWPSAAAARRSLEDKA